jgi:asparagine synthase (glutamine-hydrolysing)
MCGICGKFDLHGQGISEDLLKEMCRSFAYRGPDDEGILVSPPIGLGHRRLSIIDLTSAARQPMSNEGGDIWICFNGEIYNFQELASGLHVRGHSFKSRSDFESIVHLYEEEGISCLKYLNGMFAFALWDGRCDRLWLVRDRLGIKPLVYYWDGQQFLFASEIKALLCDPVVSRDIDPEALDLYLTLNYIPAPWTIFKNIRKLLPGHYLLLEKGRVITERYWDISAPEKTAEEASPQSGNTPEARLRTLLEESVTRRLISDVPLGAFLSGGIDSSIVVGLMAKNTSRPVETFSIGYRDLPSFDETSYAREVAQFNQTRHHEFKLGYKDILEAFPKVLENTDEPFADSSAVPTYIVSRETRNHVTVALSGDGGDELFAGYRMYLGEYWSDYYSKLPSFLRNGLISPLINALPDARDKPGLEKIRRVKKFLRGMSNAFANRFCGWRQIFPYPMRQKLLRQAPDQNLYLGLVQQWVADHKADFEGDRINLMLYLDVKGLLPGDMLTKVDRMSMANSLEVRVPFLDHTVVEYVFTLLGPRKLGPTGGKRILLETFKELLPPSLHKRPKWGFEMPIGAWLRRELRFLIDDYLQRDVIRKQDIFDYATIEELITAHMTGRRDTSWELWNLIVFQHWYRTYM